MDDKFDQTIRSKLTSGIKYPNYGKSYATFMETKPYDFYNLGIYLIVIGCSLIFSISSTILLIVIINVYLKENIESEKKPVVPSEKRVLKSRNNNFKDTE